MTQFELRPFSRIFNANPFFDQDFERLLNKNLTQRESYFTPAAEIYETADAFHISLDVPGMTQDAIDIEVKDQELHITGERKALEFKDEHKVRSERKYGKFSRVFTMPTHIKVEGIEARFENGVLTLTLPKVEEIKARKIPINQVKPSEVN